MIRSAENLALIFTVGCLPMMAAAHHSNAEWDPSVKLEFEGEVVNVVWRNPHVRFSMKVRSDTGEEAVWSLNGNSVSHLVRQGSPPASYRDFSFLAPCPASGMIVHGDKDEVVPIAAVEKLTEKVSSQKNITIDYRVIEGGDHFFADHMDVLNGHIDDYLDKVLVKAA